MRRIDNERKTVATTYDKKRTKLAMQDENTLYKAVKKRVLLLIQLTRRGHGGCHLPYQVQNKLQRKLKVEDTNAHVMKAALTQTYVLCSCTLFAQRCSFSKAKKRKL